jgi:two-component system, OmpR family, KDP operon response regulator KdpE
MTTAMFLVLVIEDDAALRSMLRMLLEAQHYRVTAAETGQRGILEARNHRPDLVIVDLGLPDMDGTSVIREIRAFTSVPVVVLTARTMEREKVIALDAGADDYVTKPFGTPELLARVRAALRRAVRAGNMPPTVGIGDITIDLSGRTAHGPSGPIHLTPLEYRLLECLTRNAGMIVTQKQLIREVWGPERLGDARGLRSYMKFLRQKLEPDPSRPRYLVTEVGVGYRLRLDDSAGEPQSAPRGTDLT